MSSPSVLIVYASTDGHTATIAHRIEHVLRDRGVTVTVATSTEAPPPAGFDAVVAGDSIHGGRHSRTLTDWVNEHRGPLADTPLAVFQVSLTSAQDDEESLAEATRLLDAFCAATEVEPAHTALFAGALAYTRYRGLRRWMMRRMAGQAGLDTDTSEDHVYTDWAAVDGFATTIAHSARRRAQGGPIVAPLVDHDPPVVAPEDSLRAAIDRLAARDRGLALVRSLDVDPLCTESLGGVVGVVSERDLIGAIADGADLDGQWVADVMSTDLLTMPGSSSPEELATAMVDRRVRHALVPDRDGRVGVVSMPAIVEELGR